MARDRGKWLARKSDGLIGFVRCNEVAMDPASLKMVMSKVTPPSKVWELRGERMVSLEDRVLTCMHNLIDLCEPRGRAAISARRNN